MRKIADVEDAADFDRWSVGAFYHDTRTVGQPKMMLGCYAAAASSRSVAIRKESGDLHLVALDEFLQHWGEHGLFRSRMVQVDYGLVYLKSRNPERAHGLNLQLVDRTPLTDLTRELLDDMNQTTFAEHVFRNKRHRFWDALYTLERGDALGCALSDNYGLIVSKASSHPQLMYRSSVVGTVVNGDIRLEDRWSHLVRVAESLKSL